MTKVFKGRSTLFIAIAFCLVALLKVTPVNAAETWGLFIFDDSTSTLSYPYSNSKATAKEGDKIQLDAKLCKYDNTNTSGKINKTDCKAVDVNYTTKNTSVVKVSNSGLVTILKAADDGATINVETKNVVEETATSTSAATKLSETYVISSISAIKNEVANDPNDITEEEDPDDEDEGSTTNFTKDVKTTMNPSTGIGSYLLVILLLIPVGCYIVLKKEKNTETNY